MPNTVSYNGQKIIPAPFINIQKEYIKSADGNVIGANFNISLIGKLVVGKGSPSGGGFWTDTGYPPNEYTVDPLANLTYKIEHLKRLFADHGKNLEVQGCAGTPPLKCYPTLKNMSFQEGNWFQTVDYNIALEAPEIFGLYLSEDASGVGSSFFKSSDGSGLYLRQANEEWSIEFNEQGESLYFPYTYKVTHNISAAGQRRYDGNGLSANGYEYAKKWVISKLGMDNNFLYASGAMNVPTYYNPYNYMRTENLNELEGTYAVVENWIVASGTATEEFNLSIKRSLEDPSVRVSVEGTIVGLEVKNADLKITTPKITNAETKYNELTTGGYINSIYNRVLIYATGVSWNSIPLSSTVGRNPFMGSITYSYEYDDRPSNLISGALMESFVLQGVNPLDVFASITVPGRAAGPVLQNMNTVSAPKFGLQIELTMPRYTGAPDSVANALAMVNSSPRLDVNRVIGYFRSGLALSYPLTFTDTDSENWNPRTGKYTRDVSWTYGSC